MSDQKTHVIRLIESEIQLTEKRLEHLILRRSDIDKEIPECRQQLVDMRKAVEMLNGSDP